MALPAQIDAATPPGSQSPALGDDRIRELKTAIQDIFGIPDATNVSLAAMDIDAGGLAQVIFYDAAATPASGELGRSGSTLYYRVTGTHTNTVVDGLGVIVDTTGAAAASIGTGILLQSESADEAPSDILRLAGTFTDVTAGSEDSVLSVSLRTAGAALGERYRFASTGAFLYTFTGAPTANRTITLPDSSITLGGLETGTWTADLGPSGTGARVEGTTYQNTSGRKRRLAIRVRPDAGQDAELRVGSASPPTAILSQAGSEAGSTMPGTLCIEVPNDWYYLVPSFSGVITTWFELDE